MILFLALQMGQEYLHVRNYDMAKRFFERIISNYQKEQWWPVLAQVQRALRECAQQLQLLPDFVSCSVALLAKDLSDAAAAAAALQQLLALVRLGNPASSSAALRSASAVRSAAMRALASFCCNNCSERASCSSFRFFSRSAAAASR